MTVERQGVAMYCPACGSPNSDGARFCQKCGGGLGTTTATAGTADRGAAPAQEPQWLPQPTPPYDERIRRAAAGKNPVVAVILSFLIPGLGQLYNGDAKKAGIMFLVWVISWALISSGIGFVTGAGVWIWGMVDAYQVANGKSAPW